MTPAAVTNDFGAGYTHQFLTGQLKIWSHPESKEKKTNLVCYKIVLFIP